MSYGCSTGLSFIPWAFGDKHEEILCPAAILIGDYLKMKLADK
jgi:hypothetical protein